VVQIAASIILIVILGRSVLKVFMALSTLDGDHRDPIKATIPFHSAINGMTMIGTIGCAIEHKADLTILFTVSLIIITWAQMLCLKHTVSSIQSEQEG